MDDLISRQAAIDALDAICDRECEYPKKQRAVMCASCHLGSAFDAIDELPSAERRGRWKALDCDCRGYATAYECSSCEVITTLPYPMKWMDYDYCPNCGAKMDEVTE